MNAPFETTVVVKAHAKFGAFRAEDGKFYKPDEKKGMKLEDFVAGESYAVKGYSSESGKTNYITAVNGGTAPAAEVAPRRRMAPEVKEKAGDDKGLTTRTVIADFSATEKKVLSHCRDFVKEAKGKTFSLIVAGLSHTDAKAEDILAKADVLLKGIEDRGYF